MSLQEDFAQLERTLKTLTANFYRDDWSSDFAALERLRAHLERDTERPPHPQAGNGLGCSPSVAGMAAGQAQDPRPIIENPEDLWTPGAPLRLSFPVVRTPTGTTPYETVPTEGATKDFAPLVQDADGSLWRHAPRRAGKRLEQEKEPCNCDQARELEKRVQELEHLRKRSEELYLSALDLLKKSKEYTETLRAGIPPPASEPPPEPTRR